MNEEERVRALLAEQGSAATGEQVPPEVAARLEDALALLVAERAGVREVGGAQVVPLRRRWLPRTLVAAAAVVVLTAGGASIAGIAGIGGWGSGGGEASTAADSASGESAGGSTAEPGADAGGANSDKSLVGSGPGGGAATLQRDLVAGEVPSVSSRTFARDVRRLLAAPQPDARAASPSEGSAEASPEASPTPSSGNSGSDSSGESPRPSGRASQESTGGCAGPRTTDGATTTPVLLDGSVAALVVHPAEAGRALVEAWNCAGTTRLATTTVAR